MSKINIKLIPKDKIQSILPLLEKLDNKRYIRKNIKETTVFEGIVLQNVRVSELINNIDN